VLPPAGAMFNHSHLHAPGETEVEVHPVVLFSIADHYSRREEGQGRVIGTLLGTVRGKKVEVCSCFPVPHTHTEEQVAVSTDFHATMLALHQRVEPDQQVVGWYSTGGHRCATHRRAALRPPSLPPHANRVAPAGCCDCAPTASPSPLPAAGEEVNSTSLLFHKFYGQDVQSPVHLLVDLGMGDRRMSSTAYISKELTLGEHVTLFC
jgi:translation initiation factor 3 subunit F